MANFNTHLIVAAAGTGLVATGCLGAEIASPREVVLYFSLGTAGGLLPDVDSDSSIISRIMFNCIAVYASFLLMFTQASRFAVIELIMVWLLAFFLINSVLVSLFENFTVHRGMFHSIPAAFAIWFATNTMAFWLGKATDLQAWFCGLFVFLGYIIHLCLDEIFSVDLMNRRIKRSFGSALKAHNPKDVPSTVITFALMTFLFFMNPAPWDFIETLTSGNTYATLTNNLFPDGPWFASIKELFQ